MNLEYLLKYTRTNEDNNQQQIQELSNIYSQQYNSTISPFDIVINSSRANTIYKNNISYKCLVDFNTKPTNSEFNNQFWRELRTKYDDGFKSGDFIYFENPISKEKEPYLIIKQITNKDGYILNYMQKCMMSIKWNDELSMERKAYGLCNEFGRGNDGLVDEKTFILGDNKSCILIQSNEYTRKFSKKQRNRFIFDNRVFQITDIKTTLYPGLLYIILEEDQTRNEKDNFETRIAENIYTDIPEPLHPTTGLVIEGNGNDGVIYCNLSFNFEAKLYEGDVLVNPQPSIVYSIDKSDLVETTQVNNLLTITPKEFITDKRDKKIILIANDGRHEVSKELTIQIL